MDIRNDVERIEERIEQEVNRLEKEVKDLIRKSERIEALKRLNRKNKNLSNDLARLFDMPEPEKE